MKKKTCFVIMPISDHSDYIKGHFKRVYEHLIKPACEKAGFEPIRADDVLSTNHIALDIIKMIISSDMAICDLSSQNPNVLYELGIRQAFNKPVTLIKDRKTKRVFDIQGFRDLEYDENLRIDTVQEKINTIAKTISNTYKNTNSEINSLVKLLGITPAKIDNKIKISTDTELILNSLRAIDKRLSLIENTDSPKPEKYEQGYLFDENLSERIGEEYTLEEIIQLKKGDLIYHNRFGIGETLKIEEKGMNSKGEFKFSIGRKKLLLQFAKLRKLQ